MRDKIISFIIGLVVGGVIVFGYNFMFKKAPPEGMRGARPGMMRDAGSGSLNTQSGTTATQNTPNQ